MKLPEIRMPIPVKHVGEPHAKPNRAQLFIEQMRVQYGLLAEATIEEALTSIADNTKRQQLGLRCGQMTHVCDCNFSDEDREWAAAYMTEFADIPTPIRTSILPW